MRCSGGTNFGLVWSVVTRTKSRIACFAGPSFHDARGDPPDVCAWASVGGHEADRTGSAARPETSVRRSIPDLPDVMPGLPQSVQSDGQTSIERAPNHINCPKGKLLRQRTGYFVTFATLFAALSENDR